MSLVPPNYWSLSHDPPKYSDVAPSSSPPPYVNSIGPYTVNLPSDSESTSILAEAYEYTHCGARNCCVLSWIIYLTILALLHLVLYGVYFKCPLPGTDLNGIRILLLLHILLSVVMIVYCVYKCRSTLETNRKLVLVTLCFFFPSALGLVVFFPLIVRDLNELGETFGNPLNVTSAYPCSLLCYELIFGLVTYNYVVAPVFLFFFCFYIVFSSHGGRFFHSTNRRVSPYFSF